MTDGLALNATLLVEGERLPLLFEGEDAVRILAALVSVRKSGSGNSPARFVAI